MSRHEESRHWDRFALPGAVWLLVLFAAPLALTVVLSFATVDATGRPEFTWTLGNYRTVVDPVFLPALIRSLVLAAVATAVCLLIGYPLAYYIARFGGGWKPVLLALVVVPFAVNYLIKIYAWITILGRNGIVNGALGTDYRWLNTEPAVVVGLVYAYLTFMILPVYAAVDRLDPRIIEAGRDLYGGRWSTFVHVVLPLTRSGVVAGCLLVFLPAVGDFVAAQLLGGSQVIMIGNIVQQQFFQSTNWPLGAAFIMVLIAVVVAGLALAVRLGGRRGAELLS